MPTHNLLPLALNVAHPNIILLLGIVIFAGTVGAKLFQRLRVPQIVGYIVIGLIIGESGLKVISAATVSELNPINLFALGIIGFMIGGELKTGLFKKYGRQFTAILMAEGIAAFLLVGLAATILAYLFTQNLRLSIALGVVLGAIASATDPASTIQVFWEYKTRGPLTSSATAVVALDDALALTLYGLGTSVAGILTGHEDAGVLQAIMHALTSLALAVALGVIAAFILNAIIQRTKDSDSILVFTLSSVLLIIGLGSVLKLDIILASMALGMTLTNITPRKSVDTFALVKSFAPPIYVLFFVLAGARLQINSLAAMSWYLVALYVLGRSAGKFAGAYLGAKMSGAMPVVRKYLGCCLFAQGGVAVGLSIVASERFDSDISHIVVAVVAATTLIVQLLGPPCAKIAAKKADEIGKNITEEDLFKTYKVRDVMDTNPPTIEQSLPLEKIFAAFSDTDALYYPVVDEKQNLLGAITLESIKESLANQKAAPWLLACDVMVQAPPTIAPSQPLEDTMQHMKEYDLQYLCVVDADPQTNHKLLGILDARAVHRKINAEILHLHGQGAI